MSFDLPNDAPRSESDSTFSSAAPSALGPGYAVKLPVFEGPLDLLLHLIRQNEMDVTDIQISLVSAQYLAYLELMRSVNLDVAGEYLVMAATLALIKSRMLLPPDDEEEEDDGIDPRAELVARLLEYQRFKEVAESLSKRRLLGRDVFRAHGPRPDPVPEADREIEVGLFELLSAFREVLKDVDAEDSVHEIEGEPVTVRDRMIWIMELLEEVETVEFWQIFEHPQSGRSNRETIVATFLAILELARLFALFIYQGVGEQGEPEGPVRIRVREDDALTGDTRSWGERISELM